MNGDNGKIVNLAEFRNKRNSVSELRVGEYYYSPQYDIHLHVAGISNPLHTREEQPHFIVEDTLGNVSVFPSDEMIEGFVKSTRRAFLATGYDPTDPQVS